jgi:hypothetical protein
MDAQTIAILAGTLTPLIVGVGAVVKLVIDRHLAALTRLEQRAEATGLAQAQAAEAFGRVADHLLDVRRDVERIDRRTTRIADHLGLAETASEPAPEPAPLPHRRSLTGSHPRIELPLDVPSSQR